MPFTPLHMGPGLAVKAVMQRKFSLLVFGWSQVVIDLQPLLAMTTGRVELHGFSHTLLGATLIGLLLKLVSDLTYMLVDPRIDFESREI